MSLRLAKKRSIELEKKKDEEKDTSSAPPPKKRAKVVPKKKMPAKKKAPPKKKAPVKKKAPAKKKAPGRKKAAPKKKAPAKKRNSKKKSKHEDYFDASSSDEDDDSSSDDDDSSSSDDDDSDDDDSSSSDDDDDDDDSDDDDSSSSSDDDDSSDDEDSDLEYEDDYDENFYKKDDAEDYNKLMAMKDVERQLVIEERKAERETKMQQFNVERRIRQRKKQEKEEAKQKKAGTRRKSTRAQSKKTTARKAALDNLAKKKRSNNRSRMSDSSSEEFSSSEEDDDDDEDYEYGGTLKRSATRKKKKVGSKRGSSSSRADDAMDVDDDDEDVKQREAEVKQPRMEYRSVIGSVSLQRKGAQLTRQDVYDDIHKPWFKTAARGMFVRVRKQHGRKGYMLMRIRKVYSGKKPYTLIHKNGLGSLKTLEMFQLYLHTEDTKVMTVPAKFISNDKCSVEEYNSYLKRLESVNYSVPRQNEIEKHVHKYSLFKKDTSDGDISAMIAMNKKFRKKAINLSTAKIETQRELEVMLLKATPEDEIEAAKLEERINELKEKIEDLKAQEEKDKTGRNAKDLRTAKINERNQLGNILRMDHAKSQVQQQAEAGAMNPFMRRATRPKILWDMHNGDKEESKKKDDDEKNKEEKKEDEAAANSKKKKEKEKILTLYDLHNFSLPNEDNLPFTESQAETGIDSSKYNPDGSGKIGYGTKNRTKMRIEGTMSLNEYLNGF